jgi:hypothetical protein
VVLAAAAVEQEPVDAARADRTIQFRFISDDAGFAAGVIFLWPIFMASFLWRHSPASSRDDNHVARAVHVLNAREIASSASAQCALGDPLSEIRPPNARESTAAPSQNLAAVRRIAKRCWSSALPG